MPPSSITAREGMTRSTTMRNIPIPVDVARLTFVRHRSPSAAGQPEHRRSQDRPQRADRLPGRPVHGDPFQDRKGPL